MLLNKICFRVKHFGIRFIQFRFFYELEILSTTIYDLFHYQRDIVNRNNTLTFFIGFKQINRVKQWESNVSFLEGSEIDHFT